jgi:hypothetical protein
MARRISRTVFDPFFSEVSSCVALTAALWVAIKEWYVSETLYLVSELRVLMPESR